MTSISGACVGGDMRVGCAVVSMLFYLRLQLYMWVVYLFIWHVKISVYAYQHWCACEGVHSCVLKWNTKCLLYCKYPVWKLKWKGFMDPSHAHTKYYLAAVGLRCIFKFALSIQSAFCSCFGPDSTSVCIHLTKATWALWTPCTA